MDTSGDVLEEQPVVGLAVAVAVAAVGYAVVTYLMQNRFDLLETVIFALVLAIVYVGFVEYFGV
jgi:hypothetical protein